MPSTFPGAIDSFTDPLANSSLASPSHSTLHSDINDAVEKVEQYMGLVKVIPTSVSSAGGTGATLNSTTGTVTVGTSNTSVTLNGVFSSLYDNYRVIYSGAGNGTANHYLRLTIGAITAGYYGSMFGGAWGFNTTHALGVNNQASWLYAGFGSTGYVMLDADIYNPNISGRNKFISTRWTFNETNSAYSMFNGELVNTTQLTSLTITPSTGTISGGSIRVYGYRN